MPVVGLVMIVMVPLIVDVEISPTMVWMFGLPRRGWVAPLKSDPETVASKTTLAPRSPVLHGYNLGPRDYRRNERPAALRIHEVGKCRKLQPRAVRWGVRGTKVSENAGKTTGRAAT